MTRNRLGPAILIVALSISSAARADQTASLTFLDPPADAPVRSPSLEALHGGPHLSEQREWIVQIEPMLWFVGPSGKFGLPVNSGTGPGAFTTPGDKIRINDLGASPTRFSPAGTLWASNGTWRFSFSGAEYDISRDGVQSAASGRLGAAPIAVGDPLKINFSFGAYEFYVGRRIWDYDFRAESARPEEALHAEIVLDLFGGLRAYDLEIGVANLASSASAEVSHIFIEPIVGVRAEAVIDVDFSLVAHVSAGALPLYSTSSFSLDVVLAFQWRPHPNVGIQIGWRQLAFDLEDGRDLDKFEYTGRLAGLFTGVVIRF